MKVITVTEFGSADVLRLEERPRPEPSPNEVLIQVVNTSVNFADIKARQGRYHGVGQPPFVPGLDVAGIVVKTGARVQHLEVGTPVVAFPQGESYAEYVVASPDLVFSLPSDIDWETAAALPTVGFTAYKLLHDVGRIEAGENILIHAAAGGVGTTAIQLARILGAQQIFGTVGRDDKKAIAEAAGADYVINYTKEDFVKEIQNRTNGQGVDLILDSIGGPISERSMDILAPFGRLVHFGSASGEDATIRIGDLHGSCRAILGFSLGTARAKRPEVLQSAAQTVLELVKRGQLTMYIGRKYPLEDAAHAHRWIESRASTGKILLEVSKA